MSGDNAFGLPADILAHWKRELNRIKIPTDSATFAHVYCRHAAPWVAKFILAELAAAGQATEERTLVYVVPHAASATVAADILQDDGLTVGESLRVMTYTDLNAELSKTPLAPFLASAVVVFDSDCGRVPTQLAVSSARLVVAWAERKARKEPLSCAAVVLAPYAYDPVGPTLMQKTISTHFGRGAVGMVLDLILGPPPQVSRQLWHNDDDTTDNTIAQEILLAGVPGEPVTVICLAPARQGLGVQRLLGREADAAAFVLTPANFAAQRTAVRAAQEKRPRVLALLIDPSMRFLPVVHGRRQYVVPHSLIALGLDKDLYTTVDQERSWCLDDIDLAVSLGQGSWTHGLAITVVAGRCHPTDEQPSAEDPRPPPPWIAWAGGFAETMLCLASQLDSKHLTLQSLPAGLPANKAFTTETLRRLRLMGLVASNRPSSASMPVGFQKLTTASPRAKLAATFLMKGVAETLSESLLLAEVAEAPTASVRLTLAAIASAVRIGVTNLVERSPEAPSGTATLEQCRVACTGIGKQMGHRGRLWIAIDLLASDPAGSNDRAPLLVVSPAHRYEYRRRFRQILEEAAPSDVTSPFPQGILGEEIDAVYMALVRAWLPNLCFVVSTEGRLTEVLQILTNRKVFYPAVGDWGNALMIQPTLRFAVHFGLSETGPSCQTDTLTPVPNEAVLHVLQDLLPNDGGEVPDFYGLMRSLHA